MQQSKLKTLYVLKILYKLSDKDHIVTTRQIIKYLNKNGIKSERKSIYTDIEALKEFGIDIRAVKGKYSGYYIATRSINAPEIRLLIDAVNSSPFITKRKTKYIIKSLKSQLSKWQAKDMHPQVYHEYCKKCDFEDIHRVIDVLDYAIKKKKMVRFKYKQRNLDNKNKKSYSQKQFLVSPYAIIWNINHYYLVCNNDKYDNLINLRVDKIRSIQLSILNARDVSEVSEYDEKFNVKDYATKMFNMFSDEIDKVKLICAMSLREDIMERFGSKIPLTAVDYDYFKTEIKTTISDGLVGYLMQYGDKIKVIGPLYLADMVKEKAQEIANVYTTDKFLHEKANQKT